MTQKEKLPWQDPGARDGRLRMAGSWDQGWTAQNGRVLGPGMDGSEWQGPGTRDGWLRMLPVSFYDISILVTQLEDVNQK